MAIAVYTSLLTLTEAPSGTVEVQNAETTDPREIFTDPGMEVTAQNPIQLDSAGRSEQGIIYTAPNAYKVVVRDKDGVQLYVHDNIDPGVPIGNGALQIEHGGTGATSSGEALSNIGAASAGELASLASDVAAVVGALGSSEKTHIATGTSAQRPETPENGDIRFNTTNSVYEGYKGSDWINFKTSDEVAAKADMETPASATKIVAPSVLHHHPAVPKAWGLISSGGSLTQGYGISSVSRLGNGSYNITFAAAFTSSEFATVVTLVNGNSLGQIYSCESNTRTTTTVQVRVFKAQNTTSTDTQAIDCAFSVAVWGDQ